MECALPLTFTCFRSYKNHIFIMEDNNDTGTKKYYEVFRREEGPY